MTSPTLPEQLPSGPSTQVNLALTPRPRSLLIDVVRGLAITLVALGHTNQGVAHRGWWGDSSTGTRLNLAIYAFHMPAFFFITGIFLNQSLQKRGPLRFVLDKVRTILWPYLLFSSLAALTLALLARFTTQQPQSPMQFLYSLGTGGFGWFLPTIFCALMLGALGHRLPPAVFFLAAALLSTFYPFRTVPILTAAIKLLPFLVLGMWVNTRYERLERIPRPLAAAIACALLALLLLTTPRIADIHNAPSYVVFGVTGTFMLLLIARVLARTLPAKTLSSVGEASFGIFLLAAYPQGATRELLLRLGHITNPFAQLLLPTACAVIVPSLLYQHRARLHLAWMFVFPW